MFCMTAAKFEELLIEVVPHMQSDEMRRHPLVEPALALFTFLTLVISECQPGRSNQIKSTKSNQIKSNQIKPSR